MIGRTEIGSDSKTNSYGDTKDRSFQRVRIAHFLKTRAHRITRVTQIADNRLDWRMIKSSGRRTKFIKSREK